MAANFVPTGLEYIRIMPELILTIVATLIMVLEAMLPERSKGVFATISVAALAAALGASLLAYSNAGPAFQDMLAPLQSQKAVTVGSKIKRWLRTVTSSLPR